MKESASPISQFEIELTSASFRVNRAGILEVAVPNLDRDPPNPSTLTFQVRISFLMLCFPLMLSFRFLTLFDNMIFLLLIRFYCQRTDVVSRLSSLDKGHRP